MLDELGLPPRGASSRAEVWLLLNSIQKDRNVGSLVRTASAFGATGVIVCGGLTAKVSMFGAKGAERRIHTVTFPGRSGLAAAVRALGARGIRLVGLEICAGAAPVHAQGALLRTDAGGVAIMPGNEASGLSDGQKALCDGFVYIPQYGSGTASLNVAAATAIALHYAAIAANFEEAPKAEDGADKFRVERGGAAADGGDFVRTELMDAVAAARGAARAAAEADAAAAEFTGWEEQYT